MSLFFPNDLSSAEDSKFYIDGQIHPAYSIKIFINGTEVKELFNKKENLKVFLFEIDKEIINEGENSLEVVYTVQREIDEEIPSSRSFRFNIRYQQDPMDSASSEKLYKARGPETPFSPVGTQETHTDTFVFNDN